MKKVFLFIALAFSVASNAQVTKVSLQASGLTCSMCSNSIHKALKTLDFIQEIDADTKTYTFEISFKPNADIDFDMIRKKVENAGFSVVSFIATIVFDNVPVMNSQPVTITGKSFVFVNMKGPSLDGVKRVKILDKGFVSPKEYKKNSFPVSLSHTYYASL